MKLMMLTCVVAMKDFIARLTQMSSAPHASQGSKSSCVSALDISVFLRARLLFDIKNGLKSNVSQLQGLCGRGLGPSLNPISSHLLVLASCRHRVKPLAARANSPHSQLEIENLNLISNNSWSRVIERTTNIQFPMQIIVFDS